MRGRFETVVHVGAIADRVARRHCDRQHEGSTPCERCADLRAAVCEGLGEFLGALVIEVRNNLEPYDEIHQRRNPDP